MDLGDLDRRSGEWLSGTGTNSTIVISSRVRLARNLSGYPFATRAAEHQRQGAGKGLLIARNTP